MTEAKEKERAFHVLMRELCSEMGIEMMKLSHDKILQLTKDGKVRHIYGNRFDINPEVGGKIACNKYATYEVLNSQNVPVVEHTIIFNPATTTKNIGEQRMWTTVIDEFRKHGRLVVKPNSGSEGKGVVLCNTLKETEIAIGKHFKKKSSVSICPFYDILTEYRTFYLNGEVHLIYGKTKPFVVGDGKSTMGKLIEQLNLPDKESARDNVSHIDLTYVPADKERVELSWKHNLSGGALPTVLERGELYNKIEAIAIQAGKAMNMNFATIDVIHTADDNLYVLEINSGICATRFMDVVDGGYEIIKEIYRKSLKSMFQ